MCLIVFICLFIFCREHLSFSYYIVSTCINGALAFDCEKCLFFIFTKKTCFETLFFYFAPDLKQNIFYFKVFFGGGVISLVT